MVTPSNINTFIDQHYEILAKGKGVGPKGEGAQIFLLGETHADVPTPFHSLCAVVNSLFINTFSNQDSRVLIENHPSLEAFDPSTDQQSARLHTKAPILGWDDREYGNLFSSKIEEYQRLLAKLEALAAQYPQADKVSQGKLIQEGMDIARWILKLALECREEESKVFMRFSERTDAMIASIVKAHESTSSIFLIAGVAHLHPDVREIMGDTELSRKQKIDVDRFFASIEELPYVVLWPKKGSEGMPEPIIDLAARQYCFSNVILNTYRNSEEDRHCEIMELQGKNIDELIQIIEKELYEELAEQIAKGLDTI